MKPDEVPSLNLPRLGTSRPYKERKSPRNRQLVEVCSSTSCHVDDTPQQPSRDACVQTEESMQQVKKEPAELNLKFDEQSKELEKKEVKIRNEILRLSHIKENDKKVCFYTGFPSYKALEACFLFLGSSVNRLCYSGQQQDKITSKRCRSRALPPLEEFF